MLKVSIITVCYNSELYIKDVIESVLNQTYKNIEYIIIDGNSKDKTIDIIKSYGNKIDKFVSEPDKGIYDAMNKGIALATGDIVGLLNSDDFYISNNIIEKIVNAFQEHQTDSVYADLLYVSKKNTNKIIRYWKSKPYEDKLFYKGWQPPHPTFFVKRNIYQRYGNFNTSMPFSNDFEILLRLLEKYKITSFYLPEVIIKMRVGGESNKSIKNIFIQNIYCYKSFKINNLKVSVFYPVLRLFPKLLQFIFH